MCIRDREGAEERENREEDSRNGRLLKPKVFYSYLLFECEVEENPLLYAERLAHQYFVDQYVKMEGDRLQYLLRNQEKLRAEDYTRLHELLGDSGGTSDETSAVRKGRLFVLPSTSVGGDRYMRNALHDMLAVTTQLGHPDIFVTMTCNPKWPEITSMLKPGQTATSRPDLCARVFHMKCRAMVQMVIDEEIFGKVVSHVKVIEFQKRGLPHAHCIFILDRESKQRLRDPLEVDKIISAEIPSADDPELREIVLKHQIHNPCGVLNPQAVCMGVRKRKQNRSSRSGGRSNDQSHTGSGHGSGASRRRSVASGSAKGARRSR